MLSGPDASGGAVWTTSDGNRWIQRPLPRIGYGAVYHPTGLFVMDGRSLAVMGPDADDPPVVVALPDPVRIGNGSDRPGLVSGLVARVGRHPRFRRDHPVGSAAAYPLPMSTC